MVSVVVIVLSLVMILLMVGNLCASALRTYRQQKNVQAVEAHTANTQGLVLVHTRQGMMVSTRNPVPFSVFVLPSSWYSRLRTYVSLSLLLMVLATFFIQRGLSDGTLQNLSKGYELFRFHTVQRERYSDGGTRDSGERLAATYAYLAT